MKKETIAKPPDTFRATRASFHHGNVEAELVAAALAAVDAFGHEALSLRDAARSIGVSHSAAYRHFADREALLAAVASAGFRAMRAAILRGAKRDQKFGDGDVVERCVQSGVACVVYCVRHARLARLMVAANMRKSAEYPELAAARQHCFDVLIDVVIECQKQGRFVGGDPRIMASALWAQVYGLAQLVAEGMFGPDLPVGKVKELADAVARMLVTGLMLRDHTGSSEDRT